MTTLIADPGLARSRVAGGACPVCGRRVSRLYAYAPIYGDGTDVARACWDSARTACSLECWRQSFDQPDDLAPRF